METEFNKLIEIVANTPLMELDTEHLSERITKDKANDFEAENIEILNEGLKCLQYKKLKN